MSLWLIHDESRTLALVSAGGRRKALLTYSRATRHHTDTTLHYSGREPYLRPVTTSGPTDPWLRGGIKATEALIVNGEARFRDEALAEQEAERV